MIRYVIENDHKVCILDKDNNELFYFDPCLYLSMYSQIPDKYTEEYTRLINRIIETIVIYFLPKVERGDLFVEYNDNK